MVERLLCDANDDVQLRMKIASLRAVCVSAVSGESDVCRHLNAIMHKEYSFCYYFYGTQMTLLFSWRHHHAKQPNIVNDFLRQMNVPCHFGRSADLERGNVCGFDGQKLIQSIE